MKTELSKKACKAENPLMLVIIQAEEVLKPQKRVVLEQAAEPCLLTLKSYQASQYLELIAVNKESLKGLLSKGLKPNVNQKRWQKSKQKDL